MPGGRDGRFGGFSVLSMVQVSGVVSKLLWAKAAELEEILTKVLQALDAVELSWSVRLCNAALSSRKVPLDWRTSLDFDLMCTRAVCICESGCKLGLDFPIQMKRGHLKVDELGYFGVLFTSRGKRDRTLGSRSGPSPASLQALYQTIVGNS